MQALRLSRYALVNGHVIHRSALPDEHPESWPSRYKKQTGEQIPEGWRGLLRIVPQ